MKASMKDNPKTKDSLEKKKRRTEFIVIIAVSLLFFSLIGFEFYLFTLSQSLPFIHSIFFFGLVNFNIILFLILIFLIFKNIVKHLSEREGGNIGTSLKKKLIAAFAGFSFIPTTLMFIIFIFYINTSFDKWFSSEMKEVLKSSLEVNKAYVIESKKKNYHFAYLVAKNIKHITSLKDIQNQLDLLRKKYKLDAIEYYSANGTRLVSTPKNGLLLTKLPPISSDFKEKALLQGMENSMVHPFYEGNLIRVIIPLKEKFLNQSNQALVVSTFIHFSLLSKIDHITSTYENLRKTNLLELPLKSIYLIILILMTLVILLSATWLGLYLARQLSIPLELLGKATHKLSQGEYRTVKTLPSSSKEINQLVSDFNVMVKHLEKSQGEVKEVNQNLRLTLKKLNEHSRYIEIILSNVSAGVISIDSNNIIKTINPYASQLLKIPMKSTLGQNINDVLSHNQYKSIVNFIETSNSQKTKTKETEVQIQIKGRTLPLHMTISLLEENQKPVLGKILVLNDLTLLVSAQRVAAWKEVVKRIAHEIKNPLTPIKLSAERLQKKFGHSIKDESFQNCTSIIIDQVDNLKSLVNEFSSFSRLPQSQPVLTSLNSVLHEALLLFKEAHKSIRWEFHPDKTLDQFLFDPNQIKRVITNLLDNSVNAVSHLSKPKIKITTKYNKSLQKTRILVEDNGSGIPPYLKDRIFEPYITTKMHGTGLGLAIAKRSVEDHNGTIKILEKAGEGKENDIETRIAIDLPVTLPFPQKLKEKWIHFSRP